MLRYILLNNAGQRGNIHGQKNIRFRTVTPNSKSDILYNPGVGFWADKDMFKLGTKIF